MLLFPFRNEAYFTHDWHSHGSHDEAQRPKADWRLPASRPDFFYLLAVAPCRFLVPLPPLICVLVCLFAVVGGMLCNSDKPSIVILLLIFTVGGMGFTPKVPGDDDDDDEPPISIDPQLDLQ